MSNALFIFAFLCVIFILTHKRNGLYRAVYPAELQFDVGLQNDEAECRYEMHGAGVVSWNDIVSAKQQEYKHDFNELDLLADQWGATVENLQHLIKDFDLFLITEDGYFRCLYLDEVMGYQSKLSEQRAAAGSKGGRSCKKSTVKASAKATASTASAIGRGRINEGEKTVIRPAWIITGEAYMKKRWYTLHG